MATDIDQANALFWNELCGSGLAAMLGIQDSSPESLAVYDKWYLDFYPYLLDRVPVRTMRGQQVLEVGLGYGTLGQKIAEAGSTYTGLDVAEKPVQMMNYRMQVQGLSGHAVQGSMLNCPFPDASFDAVVSIGCFHHTGDLQRCLDETWRVLQPGGRAFLMVYNQNSLRQWQKWPRETLRAALGDLGLGRGRSAADEAQRKAYDANLAGAAAPETVFTSIRQLKRMLRQFRRVKFHKENSDPLTVRGRTIPRTRLLSNVGRLLGLDIYFEAVK